MRKKFLICCFSFLPLLLLFFAAAAYGGEATLYWEYNTTTPTIPLSEVAGYSIHYGTVSSSYSQKIDVNVADAAVTYTVNLPSDGTWYFAVTARYSQGGESDYSNEVSKEMGVPRRPNLYIAPIETRYYLVLNKGGERQEKF